MFLKFCKFHWETPVLKYLFNRANFRGNFIKKCLQHSCFFVEFAKFLRTPILKNICERLLLKPVQISLGLPFFDNLHLWLKLLHVCLYCFCIKTYNFVCQFFLHYYWCCYNQKQSSGGVLQKRCSYKFCKIHKKTPALKTRF